MPPTDDPRPPAFHQDAVAEQTDNGPRPDDGPQPAHVPAPGVVVDEDGYGTSVSSNVDVIDVTDLTPSMTTEEPS